jgi:hypothetical protein
MYGVTEETYDAADGPLFTSRGLAARRRHAAVVLFLRRQI